MEDVVFKLWENCDIGGITKTDLALQSKNN